MASVIPALTAPAMLPYQRPQTPGGAVADGAVEAAPTIQISADDSAMTHWPCGSIVPELFRTTDANFCPRCHRVV